MLTPEQYALRRSGLGSSDSPIIMGEAMWRAPFDVYLSKVEGFEQEPTDGMELGELLEPVILELYRRRTGATLAFPGTLIHPYRHLLLDTPDAVATLPSGEVRPVEAKAYGWRGPEWGENSSDGVPPAYVIQSTHHLLVARAIAQAGSSVWPSNPDTFPTAVDLPVLFGGREFRIYTVRWDPELAEMIAAECERWWAAHVVTKTPPSMERSRTAAEWLAQKYPSNRAPMLNATSGDELIAAQLREARIAVREAEEVEAPLINELKLRIGEADGMRGDGWRITWKKNQKGSRVFRPSFGPEGP